MTSKRPIDWLLEESQPAVRYRTLTQLLDRPPNDPDVQAAAEMIPKKGWAADLLAEPAPGGWWVSDEKLYHPKYRSTNWILLVLADLGVTRSHPGIERGASVWIERFAREDGGFAMEGSRKSHLCTAGNMARALVQFGYADHPKVESAFNWLARSRDKNGGWSCFGSGRNLDSWEALSAFAVYPRAKWDQSMRESVEKGAEFYLQRELHRQGARYEPWYRFHYPAHYYYDLLVGLDFMTALGYTDDPRLGFAISVLQEKRRPDGRWNLDAVHPDVEGGIGEWYAKHPGRAPTSLSLERPGEPSKMITLAAMRVLKRLNESG